MNKKRFTETLSTGIVTDHVTKKEYNCEMRIDDKLLELLNELHEEKEQLLSDKEHLMGYLIRFCRFDDDDLDYVMSRESNREYGKQYYSMKEEDW